MAAHQIALAWVIHTCVNAMHTADMAFWVPKQFFWG